MNAVLKLFVLVAFFFFISAIFSSQAQAYYTCFDGTANCYGASCESTGYSWSDIPMSNCINEGISPPANTCNASGNWDFSYYVCQIRSDPSTGGCTYQTAANNYICSAADACWGGNGGGTGYDDAGRVIAGHCSPGSYTEGNPGSACTSYGYYKQCCSSGGINPTTYCSAGTCPAGSITSAGNTSCGAAATPTPAVTCAYDGVRCGGYDAYSGGAGCGGAYQDRYSCSDGTFTYNSCSTQACIDACKNCNWCAPGSGNCSAPTPTPTTPPGCDCTGKNCGVNSCGTGSCGTCTSPQTCGGGGTAGVCGEGSCSCAGKNCGVNSCGIGSCGTCTSPQTCGGGGTTGVCGNCTPTTSCALQGKNCGTINDGCSIVSCGTCTSPQTCGGGGTSGVCGGGGSVSCSWSPSSGVTPGGTSNLTVNNAPAGGFNYSFNPNSGYSILSSTQTTANVRFTTSGTTWTFSVISLTTGGTLATCNVSTSASATPTPTPISTVTVQGRFVDASGNNLTTNIGQGVTINSSAPDFKSNSTFWSNALAPGTYTVTASVPSGYIVTSSSCTNCVTHTTYNATNPVVVTLLSDGNYADIYFKYAPNVCTTTFSGNLIVDPDTVNCAALGGSLFTDFGQVSAFNGSAPARQQVIVSGGTYNSLTYSPTCGTNSFITLSAVPYTVTGVCDNGTYIPQTGYAYPYTSTPDATRTVSFLLTSQGPWFQVGTGDVRFPNLTNKIPRGLSASTNGASLFASSTGNVTLGAGILDTATNWKINQEYSYNNDFKNGLGSMSYSFYLSRAKQRNITISPVTSPVNLSNLAGGVHQIDGDLTITGNVTGGKHIILLVGGTASVDSNISVPTGAGNLFVLAAKGGININQIVGSAVSSTTPSIEGYYTSEGNIRLNGINDCSTGTDLRLNVGGALIANSLHPFAEAGLGKIVINRNICASNLTQPTYYVSPRPDLLFQMTDFYKIPYKTYKEVNP